MKNGEDASTSKIDEEDLPPLQGIQDTKHFKDLELPVLARDAKDWSKTVKILPEREALAKNKQRKAVAQAAKDELHKQLNKQPKAVSQEFLQAAKGSYQEKEEMWSYRTLTWQEEMCWFCGDSGSCLSCGGDCDADRDGLEGHTKTSCKARASTRALKRLSTG